MSYLYNFIFWYPVVMSLVWIAGSIIFYFYRERKQNLDFENIDWPAISILVPCYNEAATITETIERLVNLSYPNKEIIAVNDGSSDETASLLYDLAARYDTVRFIDCQENRGKANALHLALHASTTEYLVCVDSDAILEDTAPYYLVYNFLHRGERLGAVTGNPRIRNRNTLLGRLQLVEYASIIGSIKRTQRILGKIMTVSGVVVAFRKKALIDVGLWDRDMITEDIAVSWKLQKNYWDIRYEPRALCWMLVPEKLGGYFNQRVRWAQGGQEVILRHWNVLLSWKSRRLWPIYLEQWASLLWSYCWVISLFYVFWFATKVQDLLIWFTLASFILVCLSVIQLLISMKIDSKYDDIRKYAFFVAWYPALYWMLNAAAAIVAFPKAIQARIKGGYATWNSPDRGNIKKTH